jgi:predicted N-acetyltransferase YhbS
MSFSILPADQADSAPIEALIDRSFGPDRKTRTVYRFRDGIPALPRLTFLARGEDDALLGSIAFWPVRVSDGTTLPLLGPLAVQPYLRGYGIGRALVTHGLTATRLQNWPAVLIVGDPGYYAPFGFSVEPVAGLTLPGPVAPLTFMGLEFRPGALSSRRGTVDPATG